MKEFGDKAMIDHLQSTHTIGAMSATVLSIVVVLLFACGPGGPNDPIPTSATDGSSLEDVGSVTSSPRSSTTTGFQSKQNPAVPEWMTQALTSPDVQVRLAGLETWVRRSGRGAIDPLMLALNDPDEGVRNRAMKLIEQDWIAEQALLSK